MRNKCLIVPALRECEGQLCYHASSKVTVDSSDRVYQT